MDELIKDNKDPEAKGIRDLLLDLQIILMLLLLAEVLVPINIFCKFLQTRNLNHSLVMGKFQHVVSKLETSKNKLSNHSSVDTTLEYFKLAKRYVLFLEEAMSLARELRSRDNEHNSVNDIISTFTTTSQPVITSLIAKVKDAMHETSPVLSQFDLFNPDAVFKDVELRKEYFRILTDHFGQKKQTAMKTTL